MLQEKFKKLKLTLRLNQRSPLSSSLKNNKNEYQHCPSSTSNTNFMSILRFEGARYKKASGAVSKRGTISKKFWISHFFGSRQKSNTHAS